MSETVITVVVPDGKEDQKDASILLRRGANARLRKITFSTLADLAAAMHDLSLAVQEIEFAQPKATKSVRKKSHHPIAPVGASAKPEAVAADFAVKQMTLF